MCSGRVYVSPIMCLGSFYRDLLCANLAAFAVSSTKGITYNHYPAVAWSLYITLEDCLETLRSNGALRSVGLAYSTDNVQRFQVRQYPDT